MRSNSQVGQFHTWPTITRASPQTSETAQVDSQPPVSGQSNCAFNGMLFIIHYQSTLTFYLLTYTPPQCFSFVEKYEDDVVATFVKLVQSKSFVEKRKSPLKKALKQLCNDQGMYSVNCQRPAVLQYSSQ